MDTHDNREVRAKKGKYLPVYAYAKKMNTSVQNVYRWIRENKFAEDEVKKEIITVTRIKILDSCKPVLSKKY